MSLLLLLLLLQAAVIQAFTWPQSLQGHDDDSYTRPMAMNGQMAELQERYTHIAAMQPGIRRYNMFWGSVEPNPSTSAPPPGGCPAGLQLVPANETDRQLRGYHNYHCYDMLHDIKAIDTLLTMDQATGAQHAAILWAAPEWAIYSNCTGFPWGSSMERGGCVPRPECMDDYEDYVNMLSERYHANSTYGPLRYYVVWNEIISAGWMDFSPRLPNRIVKNGTTGDQQLTAAQYKLWADVYADMMVRTSRAALRNNPEAIVWFSSDHFWLSPKQQAGDVLHISLNTMLDAIWERINTSIPWGLVVHPYDDGDPRHDLWDQGIYTFKTLNNIFEHQAAHLRARGLGLKDSNNVWMPQLLMYPSEQGWPVSPTMNQTLRARNICYAQYLSEQVPTLIAVTHNYFQETGATQGGASFGLIPANVSSTLSNGTTDPCYNAYVATSLSQWNRTPDNYCCVNHLVGCGSGK